MIKIIVSLILLFMLVCTPILAWNEEGHMLVAQIAYNQLNETELQKIENDLKGFKPFFPKHSSALLSASWPDYIRSRDINTFTNWHFIDRPYTPDNFTTPPLDKTNILWALDETYGTLKSSKSGAWGKNFMLRFLLHLVADLHQPFHNVELYSQQYPHGDMGGNKVKVWYHKKYTNLHSFWDSGGGMFNHRFSAPLNEDDKQFIQTVASDLVKQVGYIDVTKIDFDAWSKESYQIATSFGYPDAMENRNLTEDYINKTQEICKEQIVKAGFRLGYVLKTIYADKNDLFWWDYWLTN